MSPATVPIHAGWGTAPTWRPFLATIGHCVLWGPLLGGLPFNVFLLPIPFSYAFGALPALFGGVFYALWLHAPTRFPPDRLQRMLFGGLCGAIGVVIIGVPLRVVWNDLSFALTLLPFGALGGILVGGLFGETKMPPALVAASPGDRHPYACPNRSDPLALQALLATRR